AWRPERRLAREPAAVQTALETLAVEAADANAAATAKAATAARAAIAAATAAAARAGTALVAAPSAGGREERVGVGLGRFGHGLGGCRLGGSGFRRIGPGPLRIGFHGLGQRGAFLRVVGEQGLAARARSGPRRAWRYVGLIVHVGATGLDAQVDAQAAS